VSVAEVGCGSGYLALPAARIVEPESVYALDLDEELLGELDYPSVTVPRTVFQNLVTNIQY
jgi:protein-L-isoaspartate O-methyltransferase